MKIKSLLLGSAAASMLAATGAQAADPIVYVEPEPMEYVRICDVYGAGFFNIPGTETSLQISGFARYQIGAHTENDGLDEMPNFHGFTTNDGWNKNARLRINFDARNETEWGTLRSFLRVQADNGNGGDGNAVADQVYMEFAGFLIGYTESLWFGHGGFSDTGMSYGYQQRNQIRYTFAANGFAGAVALEQDNDVNNYMPDVVGELSFTQGWGSVLGTVGYDESADGFGAAVSATVNVGATGGRFKVSGFYSENIGVAYAPSMVYLAPATTGAAEWSILAAYSQPLTETLTGIAEYQYLSGHDSDAFQHAALGSLVWTPVTGLEIRSEVAYVTGDDALGNDLDGTWSGFLRFQRNF